MVQLINLLAANLPDWAIPWAGIGALCAGLGSLLTGIAALRSARKQGAPDEKDTTRDSPDL